MAERLTPPGSAEKGERVRDLGRAYGRGKQGVGSVRSLVVVVVRDQAWRDFIVPGTGEHVTYGPDEFALFVKAPPFAGLGADLDTIRALCEGDEEAERALDEAELPVRDQGRPEKGNNVTFSPTPDDERGNARIYTLRRLKRDHPELAAMVVAGEMSANAAAIEAGFRKRDTPLETLHRAWAKATEDERAAFLAEVGRESNP